MFVGVVAKQRATDAEASGDTTQNAHPFPPAAVHGHGAAPGHGHPRTVGVMAVITY